MIHEEKAVAYAHADRLRSALRDSDLDLAKIADAQDQLTRLREGIIVRRIGMLQELDNLRSQIEQPE